MPALAESQRRRHSLAALLLTELAPREGRWAGVARIAIACSTTVAIAMVFQIPQPNYMAYFVFALSKDEKSATVTSSVGALVAVTFAVVVTLGLALVDTAEPAIRLPLMALATFAAMFTARTFALGPISYLAGFVIVLLQSLVDDARSPEGLTRSILWIWVVMLVPVAVTVVITLISGQGAAKLIGRTVSKVLREIAQSLVGGDYAGRCGEWRAQLAPLIEMARAAEKSRRLGRVTLPAILALLDALVVCEAFPADLPAAVREELAGMVLRCLSLIETSGHPGVEGGPLAPHPTSPDGPVPAVRVFGDMLSRLEEALRRPGPGSATQASPEPKHLFVADAFTNPAHWQFAVKTTVAVMFSYAIYTMLDWPGLRTAIVTCFFVALSSLGETVHKLILRLSGAAIGGLAAALCIVFVLPHLTDIGQLCLVIGAVSLGAAWVATSSELLAYAGMQIAFAFFLGILHGYAPATDLTVLRDRMVGIMLGNIAVTLVFSSIWPVSARAGIRAALSEALRAIAGVLCGPTDREKARVRTANALVRADHLRSVSLFELRMLPRDAATRTIPGVNDLERLAGAAFVVAADGISPYIEPEALARHAQWAKCAADSIATNRPAPQCPFSPHESPALASTEPANRNAQRALELLESEVLHVASAMQ